MSRFNRDRDKAELMEERRRLLEHVLETFKARGGRVTLPIGMGAAEPWLLDAIDAGSLLGALRHHHHAAAAGSGGAPPAPIDLLLCCRRSTRSAASYGQSLAAAAAAPGEASLDGAADGGAAEEEAAAAPPELAGLPQLATGLAEVELNDLAYLVFAANASRDADADVLATVRGQLGVDEARADEAARLLGLAAAAAAAAEGAGCSAAPAAAAEGLSNGGGGAAPPKQWAASLQLPLALLRAVRPRDFRRFRAFVVWRDTLAHVLLATLAQSVRDGWRPKQQQPPPPPPPPLEQGSDDAAAAADAAAQPTAQQLMARLKGALRRLDVRDADDYDAGEYAAAVGAVCAHVTAIAENTAAGWALPWGLRVRLAEVLLRGVFDAIDEAAYVGPADEYLQLLQARVWPLLGVSPAVHNALFAWVHFRQFAATRAPALLGRARALLKRLSNMAPPPPPLQRGSSEGGGGRNGSAGGSSAAAAAAAAMIDDAALARAVGAAAVEWTAERLSDCHARLGPLGGPEALPALADVLAFAGACRGDGPDGVGDLLAGAVRGSVGRELQRRLAAEGELQGGEAAGCAALCRVVRRLAREEVETYARGFCGQLLEAVPLALATLHAAAGARLLPWLAGLDSLDDATCAALRAAMRLEPRLLAPVAAAAPGCQHPSTRQALASARSWDTAAQLQPVLAAWVSKQISGFGVWVDRALQAEDWKPLGAAQAHSASARELRRIIIESLDALFGLGLPLPAAIVSMHMEGIDGVLHRYLKGVLDGLGGWAVMVPPAPAPLVRYKREVALKQEEGEAGLPGLPRALPPPGCQGRRGAAFLPCVRRTADEPAAARVEAVGRASLVVRMASLAYLLDALQPVADAVAEKWQEELELQQQQRSGGGGDDDDDDDDGGAAGAAGASAPNPFLDGSSGGGSYSNPFLASGGGGGGGGGGDNPFRSGGGGGAAPPSTAIAGAWGSSGPATRSASFGGSGRRAAARGEELFGAMLEAAGQSLRSGIAAVLRWLAVRVVWWEQRAGWCELLYRHRVSNCRIDWLRDALARALDDAADLLPPAARLDVAAALLREAALGLERALIDGGPCRWFAPQDAALVGEDVERLKRLFFADGEGVSVADINAALAGVEALLALMARETAPLVELHRAARRALPPTTPNGSGGGGGADAPWAGGAYYTGGGGGSPRARTPPGFGVSAAAGGGDAAALGPLAAGKALRAPPSAGGAALAARAGANGASGGGVSPRGRVSGSGGGGGGGGGYSNGAPPTPRAPFAASAAALVAAGGDVAASEPLLLRVLCHRADHAASKYLKEELRVPKLRDETLGEALGRLTRLLP